MPSNVESMFYVREAPWHGLGNRVEGALSSEEALIEAGLDWTVIQKSIQTEDYSEILGYKANIRETDQRILGVVTDRYKIVQNQEAFAFVDDMLGEGVKFETAGSLQNGKRVWLLAKLPKDYVITGDQFCPYMLFSNSHDGTGSIKVAMTPIRIVCQNTLNLALANASRIWSTVHKGNIQSKLDKAKETLLNAENYMDRLNKEAEQLHRIKIPDHKVQEYIKLLLPVSENATKLRIKNIQQLREDLHARYFEAPDLKEIGSNGYRFINAVSDFATHAKPLRETATFQENLFMRTIDGNPLIDKAYELILDIA
ncbi:DUF932 domain-containing protein [Paenibacillus sp. HB172176]|uniref:DUF932 domain-containing protein n=1 Tax=Paenibacillus sp. HB172176 TaxID=2493690 RepID=UPI0014397C8E|nr:DUF932 domain-containing protein [Paenibacillus sp. HB172176]